jgi:hypothetical protein
MEKKNFEAFANLLPLKENAVQICGEEFIEGFVGIGLCTKDDKFW